MNPTSAPDFHILSTPVAPPRAVSHGPAGAPDSSHEPVPDAPETPGGGGAPRGRSGGYSARVLEMVCAAIREYGLSDSAAAVRTGMSATTLWVVETRIPGNRAAAPAGARGLPHPAAANRHEIGPGRKRLWLARRDLAAGALFPGDYAPRAREREAHRDLERQARERENSDAFYQKLRDEQAERKARFDKANQEYQEALKAYEAQQAAAELPGEPGAPAGAEEAEIRASASERDLQIVQNSVAAEAGQAGTPAPAAHAASVDPLQNVQNSPAEQHEGHPKPGQNSGAASESALHSVKNSRDPALVQERGHARASACYTL